MPDDMYRPSKLDDPDEHNGSNRLCRLDDLDGSAWLGLTTWTGPRPIDPKPMTKSLIIYFKK